MPFYSFWHRIYTGKTNLNPSFMTNDFEALKNRVREFLEGQPDYSQKPIEKLEVDQEDEHTVSVVYGDNPWAGIAGLGANIDQAYDDFVTNWKRLKGFEWIEKNR